MTQNEADKVVEHVNYLHDRIAQARRAMREQNYGTAFDLLSDPIPVLEIHVDDSSKTAARISSEGQPDV